MGVCQACPAEGVRQRPSESGRVRADRYSLGYSTGRTVGVVQLMLPAECQEDQSQRERPPRARVPGRSVPSVVPQHAFRTTLRRQLPGIPRPAETTGRHPQRGLDLAMSASPPHRTLPCTARTAILAPACPGRGHSTARGFQLNAVGRAADGTGLERAATSHIAGASAGCKPNRRPGTSSI